MNIEERAKAMKKIFNKCLELAERKGKGYGEKDDAFANLRKHGIFGILVRLHDKFARVENLYAKLDTVSLSSEEDDYVDMVKSFEDNLLDIINYTAYVLILFQYDEHRSGNE